MHAYTCTCFIYVLCVACLCTCTDTLVCLHTYMLMYLCVQGKNDSVNTKPGGSPTKIMEDSEQRGSWVLLGVHTVRGQEASRLYQLSAVSTGNWEFLWLWRKEVGVSIVLYTIRAVVCQNASLWTGILVDKYPRTTYEYGNHVRICAETTTVRYSRCERTKNMVNSGVRGTKDRNLRSRWIGKLL
jgi:hypothetical protein